MNKLSLQAKARELLRSASEASSGRAADTIYGGHEKRLRQTVIALRAGTEMAEHESQPEATLSIIRGQLWLIGRDTKWFGREWSYLVVPAGPHSIRAETDACFLFAVATRD